MEEFQTLGRHLFFVVIVCFFFFFMIQESPLPPSGRVHAIMIDAGSTGTRAQLFVFQHSPDKKRLVLNATKMFSVKRSVAVLAAGDSEFANQFFKPLLDQIKPNIPGVRRRKATPIALRATAGLRLLGPEMSEAILSLTKSALNSSEYMFKEDWASVLSETEEANYAWTTVNYLLGNLDPEKDPQHDGYVGALELGGASLQTVFRPSGEVNPSEGKEGKDPSGEVPNPYPSANANIELFERSHTLHSRSHLGYGLFDFTKKLYLIFDNEGVLKEGNPCFRRGKLFENKRLRLGVPGSEESRTITLTGDGDFERCVASAEYAISSFGKLKDERSVLPKDSTFYAFAYFYDRTVKLGLSGTPTQEDFVAKGKELCESGPNVAVPGDFDEACTEFSYIYAIVKILTNNFSKSDNVKIIFEQFIDQHMLGWALGAVLDTVNPVMHEQLKLDEMPPLLPA